MTPFTPAQQRAIQTWTEQRDSLLREIRLYTAERDTSKAEADGEAQRLTDIQRSIAECEGRIAGLLALEERTRTSVSTDVSELEIRKSRLEGECAVKEAELKSAEEKHVIVTSATAELSAAHGIVTDQAQVVKSLVSDIIEASNTNLSDTKTMMIEIKTVSDQVIEKGNENVKQTGIVLEKLPRFVFELQKPIPMRRAYATPKGTIIRPDEPKAE